MLQHFHAKLEFALGLMAIALTPLWAQVKAFAAEQMGLNLSLFVAVLVTMGIDFVLGFALAGRKRDVASKEMAKGQHKLLVYFALIVMAMVLAPLSGFTWLDEPVYGYLIAREVISIFEKMHLLGFPVPAWMLKRLRVFIDKDPNDSGPHTPPPAAPAVPAVWLLLAIASLTLGGCGTRIPERGPCEQTYGPCGETRVDTLIERVDTLVYIEGATIEREITRYEYDTLAVDRPVIVTDSETRAQLTFWRNAHGNLIARCTAQADSLTLALTHTRINSTRPAYTPPPPRCPECLAVWKIVLGSFGIAVVALGAGFGIGKIT